MSNHYKWWQNGIIYQIYPRSYQDSNGDGIGDLNGIRQRLDYLQSLGVDAVWLSPIYPSPMHDFGYDVADYTDIHPLFGDMNDFDQLLQEVHGRGLKLLLDLVPNHTSDQHPWFVESRSSRDNPKRDWYIWRDPPADGGLPTNWISYFSGPTWTFDEATGQYYLHQFDPHQPELNYRHPEVLPAMLENMRFWLEKGVDGFRVDVIWLLLKDEQFRDEPDNPDWDGVFPYQAHLRIHTSNLSGVHAIIREMRKLLDSFEDRMMMGELYMPFADLMKYYGNDGDECHLSFNFHLLKTPWQAEEIKQLVENYEASLPEDAWPNWVLGNHDQHRLASRIGAQQARVANMLLLTLRGTPTTYYGEEIGMQNVAIPKEKIQDPPALNDPEQADLVGRDPERTPMQWGQGVNAGFTDAGVEPWLPVAADYTECNVAVQEEAPTSMLNLYRTLTSLRREHAALSIGDYTSVEANAEGVFSYLRTAPGSARFLIVLNLAGSKQKLDLSHVAAEATIAVSTAMDRGGKTALSELTLREDEGLVLQI